MGWKLVLTDMGTLPGRRNEATAMRNPVIGIFGARYSGNFHRKWRYPVETGEERAGDISGDYHIGR